MAFLRKNILILLPVFILGNCQTKSSAESQSKLLHYSDLKNVNYLINDSTLSVTEANETKKINFLLLDSARKENSNDKIFTIGIASFSKETPDHLKEIAALIIGSKYGASEIRIMRDKTSYDASIISAINIKEQASNLVANNWEFSYILK